jgi:glyoxylase-like metal-dependent hydrolase (beta-lactamase superfamily II)
MTGTAATSTTHPAYGELRPVTDTASVLLANNPGLMTLEGTNTWVLRGPRSDEVVVVDPGPDDDEHIAKLAAVDRIALVLISHRHGDHTDAIDKLVDLTGAPVRSADAGCCPATVPTLPTSKWWRRDIWRIGNSGWSR